MNILSKGLNIYQASYILALIIIIFFAIAFIGLAILYFNSRKKIILHSIDDEEILNDVNNELTSLRKKNKKNIKLKDFYIKRKRNSKIARIIYDTCISVFFLGLLFGVGFSFIYTSSNMVWFGDKSSMIIETTSMSSAYKSNTYLFDEKNNELEKYERIQKYALITISKNQSYIDELKEYDVAAFKMMQDNEEITVVHRLIKIEIDESTNTTLYTFRGDANPSSLVNETKITKDKIVGVLHTTSYHGFNNAFVGYLIKYLKSNIGIILVVVGVMLLFIYTILFDKVVKIHDERFKNILFIRMDNLNYKIKKYHDPILNYQSNTITSRDEEGIEFISIEE